MRKILATLVAFHLVTASVGCSHQVIIESSPPGAEIKVNGEKIGAAPVTYSESTGWEKIYDIEATKPGFKPTRKQVKQTEWNVPVTVASAGTTLITGFICFPALIGLLWARQLPDRVVVQMERGAGETGEAAPPSSYGY